MNGKIVKKNLSEQIYDTIKYDIFEQRIHFGDKLINRELREQYNVSSTPVRDAINRLYQDGLLEEITRSGAKVISMDSLKAQEYNEICGVFCGAALRITAAKGTRDDVIHALETSIHKQEEAIGTNAYFKFDQQFHETFFIYCKNSQLYELYQRFGTIWELFSRAYSMGNYRIREKALAQHKLILEAYRKKEYETAQTYMEKHYAEAGQYLGRKVKF